jgi:predicted N-formylglutamate amidohydrolase
LSDFVLFTCEHGGNRVPAEYARLFRGHRKLLDSHRGFDPGALDLARTCARRLKVPLHFATITRLLVELNRSANHPRQISVATASLSVSERQALRAKHYDPYRTRVETEVEKAVKRGERVIHVSFHTFTPELDGVVRRADVGLLYDPSRAAEAAFCSGFRQELASRRPDLVIRKNYPYLGKTDGLTTSLRKKWNGAAYLGIELEINQRWPFGARGSWTCLQRNIAEAASRLLKTTRTDIPQ